MRGFSRELIECTQCVDIEIVNSGETLREVQSLKEDKSWKINPGRIVEEIPRSHLKMTWREYPSNKDITWHSENTLKGMITLKEDF